MPTPTAPTPVAATPAPAQATPPQSAPVSPASAPAADTPPAKPAIGSAKEEGSRAHRLFQRLADNAPEAREDSAPVVAPEKPKEELVKPAATAEPEKPIKVTKKVAKRPDLPVNQPPPVASVPAPQAPVTQPAHAASSNWEDDLLDEERAALEDARFAEQAFPEHKGLAARYEKFLKEHKEFLDKNPDVEDSDPRYQKLLTSRPELSIKDRRRITEARVSEGVKKQYQPEIEDLRHELYVRDEEPRIQEEGRRLVEEISESALPKEMHDFYKTNGVAKLRENYPDEWDVVSRIVTAASEDAKELLRITRVNPKTGRPVAKVAADRSDPKWEQHERLAKLVDQVCEEFKNTGGDALRRDGKWFVTREEWANLPANARSQYWTFTNSPDHIGEIIGHAKKWIPGAVESTIKQRRAELERRGYQRRSAVAPAAPSTPPTPVASASSPRSAPIPSASASPGTTESRGSMLARRLNGA